MATAEQLARMSTNERQDLYRLRRITLKGVHKLPTVRVVRKSDGHECTINEADYDASIHDLASEVPTKATPAVEDPESAIGYTRDELETMSIADLKLLPEWEGVEGRSRLKTKEAIVDALLEVM